MTVAPAQTIEEKIAACWHRGDSIGETRVAVERATGTKPAAHEVQSIFADLSHLAAAVSR